VSPRRWPLVVAAVIGTALIVMPVAVNMFARAPKGATMLTSFRPFMTSQRLEGFQTDIRTINAAVVETDRSVVPTFASFGVDRAQFEARYPSFTALNEQWPAINSHMSNLLDDVQGNLGNYEAIAALPSFRLFPWFFVVPGVLILGASLLALARPRWWRRSRWIVGIVGVGLVLAPGAFQMFQRAPDGGHMMTSFQTIETTANVKQIQGYFGTIGSGQGDLRLGIVPSLEQNGLTSAQISGQFPAVTAFNRNWIHILNDMTPMIGAMSDNVPNYQAIASLPPFPLFPWFFVVPGVVLIGAALVAADRRDTTRSNSNHQGET
jgi:hypothetical protein